MLPDFESLKEVVNGGPKAEKIIKAAHEETKKGVLPKEYTVDEFVGDDHDEGRKDRLGKWEKEKEEKDEKIYGENGLTSGPDSGN